MRPTALRMRRFGSFTGEAELRFPPGPGLYLMRGENGAGKSTAWDALAWVLFGKDARGMRAGDVASWGSPKEAWVELDFEHLDVRYRIKRAHSPNFWKIWHCHDDGASFGEGADLAKGDGAANVLQDMLRLDYEPFMASVLLAQRAPMFLDLKPEPKAALFSSVMGLDRWDRYSARAAELQRAAEASCGALRERSAELEGRVAQIDSGSFSWHIAEFERQREERLSELADRYGAACAESRRLEALVGPAAEELERANKNVTGWMANKATHDALLLEMERQRQRAADEASRLGERLDRLVEQAANLKGAKECPLCGRPGGMAHVVKDYEGLAGAALEESHRAELEKREAEARVAKARAAVERSVTAGKKADDRVRDAAASLASARNDLLRAERELDRMEEEADRIREEGNPYVRLEDAAARDREQHGRELGELQRQLAASAERAEKVGFWVRGFKDLRLGLVGDALDGLAIEANGAASALGLTGWSLEFETDRETKAGTVQRGFNVLVRSPANDRQVPWEAWSGGESQRLRVAAQVGLADLVRAQAGVRIPLEVWDEPTDGMDAAGIAALLEALRERAHRERRQVWVIDHRALGHGGFDGSVLVAKCDNGSEFKEQTW